MRLLKIALNTLIEDVFVITKYLMIACISYFYIFAVTKTGEIIITETRVKEVLPYSLALFLAVYLIRKYLNIRYEKSQLQ